MKRDPRQHDKAHLDFIRSLPCCICGDSIHTQAAHIRFSDARIGKVNAGVGAKPHDRFTVPLCNAHHDQQHSMSETGFWKLYKLDPILISLALYSVSGDTEEAERILNGRQVSILAAG